MPTDADNGIFRTSVRLLTFRLSHEEFAGLGNKHLIAGLIFTWIVGIGRWWDDPNANLLQHLGIGSVVYIFCLALVIWLLVKPLGPANWSYKQVLTFISLTSPPAILYAIPVERFVELETAVTLNVWFLATVALWRVVLLFFYLRRSAKLSYFAVLIVSLLPLMGIVTILTMLNMERAVFDIMGGLRTPGTPNDGAYAVLFILTFFSTLLFIPALAAYFALVVHRQSSQPSDSEP